MYSLDNFQQHIDTLTRNDWNRLFQLLPEIESEDDAPDKTAELKQKYLVSNHPTSQFATLILALTGRAIGKGIELSNLIGIRGLAEVMHNTNANSDTFANITELSDIVQVEQSLVSGCI